MPSRATDARDCTEPRYARLTQWETVPCVRQLDERLYDWNTTLSALTN
jgi:hypothetical protein